MPNACLSLNLSTGTRLFAGFVPSCGRTPDKLVLTAMAMFGDVELQVQPLSAFISKSERISIYDAVSKELVGVAVTAQSAEVGATKISVEVVDFLAYAGDTGDYLGLTEVIGVEAVNAQSTTQLNSVTLMNSGGWVAKSGSQAEWNFQLTGYVTTKDSGYKVVKESFFTKKTLYIERHLVNGEIRAGIALVSSFSDQLQGAGYVQYSVTFDGRGIPSLAEKTITTKTVAPPPITGSDGTVNSSFDYSSPESPLTLILI